jgi:hypothetical protein
MSQEIKVEWSVIVIDHYEVLRELFEDAETDSHSNIINSVTSARPSPPLPGAVGAA